MKHLLHLTLLVLLVCGCAQKQQIHTRMEFPIHEYEKIPRSGTGIVKGQAFLTTRGGDVKVAAGQRVFLIAVTSYSVEWASAIRRGARLEDGDSRGDEYDFMTLADGDGRFTFENVPPWKYFIFTNVTWDIQTRYGLSQQGGFVYSIVDVGNDRIHNVVVNSLFR